MLTFSFSSRFFQTPLYSLFALLIVTPAMASAPSIVMKIDADDVDPNAGSGSGALDFMDGISRSQTALGSMWGLRPWLSQYGMSFNLLETSEVQGNVSGGIHQSFDYDGLTQMALQMDTQRAFGFYGGTFNISALQIHGRDLSTDNLGALQTSSGIQSPDATRLWEMWYQQKFLDEDRMDVKIGQQSLDQEFMVSANSNYFMNTMMGWPMVPTADLPGGGPAYPLSALGVRVRGRPDDHFTVLGGVFNGSPTNKTGVNDAGTGFPLDDGALAIAEVQYAYPALGSLVSPDNAAQLSGTYKLGVWYDTENFADLDYDSNGLSLADPSSNGNPLQHHGDYGLYAVADQMVWVSEDLEDRTLNLFARAMGTPETDRNLIDFSVNAGLTLHEPIPLRDDDTVGVGFGYANVSSRAAAFDKEMAMLNPGTYTPVRTSETFLEATYQYQIMPWWQVQPDFQYIFNPGAGAVNATNQRLGNEAIIGLRTNISF